MRKLFVLAALALVSGLMALGGGQAEAAPGGKFADCTTIPQGVLTYSAGHLPRRRTHPAWIR